MYTNKFILTEKYLLRLSKTTLQAVRLPKNLTLKNASVSEFNEFKPRRKPHKNRFQLSETNQILAAAQTF